jgi:hypothetical protein
MDYSTIEAFGTDLISASAQGNIGVVRSIVFRSKTNMQIIMFKNEHGDTALHRACHHGHIEAVRLLVAVGSDIHARSYVRSFFFFIVIQMCCLKHQLSHSELRSLFKLLLCFRMTPRLYIMHVIMDALI